MYEKESFFEAFSKPEMYFRTDLFHICEAYSSVGRTNVMTACLLRVLLKIAPDLDRTLKTIDDISAE